LNSMDKFQRGFDTLYEGFINTHFQDAKPAVRKGVAGIEVEGIEYTAGSQYTGGEKRVFISEGEISDLIGDHYYVDPDTGEINGIDWVFYYGDDEVDLIEFYQSLDPSANPRSANRFEDIGEILRSRGIDLFKLRPIQSQ